MSVGASWRWRWVACTSTLAGAGAGSRWVSPVEIAAPRELLYEILSAPYLGRARSDTIDVLAASGTLVLAAHLTKVHFYEARTVKAIELEPPSRMGFRHLTGPVPEATRRSA